MPILNLSYAQIKDAALFARYVRKAAEVMTDYDVEVLFRGEYVGTMAGAELGSGVGAVFRYPDMETATAFFTSEAYRALIPLRDEACTMTIHLFEEPS